MPIFKSKQLIKIDQYNKKKVVNLFMYILNCSLTTN
jgi:hypothetical protein